MPEHDDRPLRLEQLADVESPDVLRAALARFRRRTLGRGAFIAVVILAVPLVFRGINADNRTYEEKLARALTHEIGEVFEQDGLTVAVESAQRLLPRDSFEEQRQEPGLPPLPDPMPGEPANRVLNLTLIVPDVRGDEEIGIGIFPGGGPGERPADASRADRAVGARLAFAAGQRSITFKVYATTGVDGGGRSPGSHTEAECAEPLNPLGVCEILKSEGRVIGTVTIDLASLGIPDEIWKV